jgi:hypothetical protein
LHNQRVKAISGTVDGIIEIYRAVCSVLRIGCSTVTGIREDIPGWSVENWTVGDPAETGSVLLVEIEDSGAGQDEQERAFDRWARDVEPTYLFGIVIWGGEDSDVEFGRWKKDTRSWSWGLYRSGRCSESIEERKDGN